ncbi:MAG: DUF2511 domain-containing protein [Pseudaminobacter sp.]|nr:DUF2511 domain-containing protein [Pseudaminobacter sp.]
MLVKQRRNAQGTASVCLILAILAGCSKAEPDKVAVSRDQYGDDWPFPFDTGSVRCDPPGTVVVIDAEGQTYALNGKARGLVSKRDYIDPETFRERGEYGEFLNGVKTIPALIEVGLASCDKYYGDRS